jgi:hypothetical protein
MLAARHEHDAPRLVIRTRTALAACENLPHDPAEEVAVRLDAAPAGELFGLHGRIVNWSR